MSAHVLTPESKELVSKLGHDCNDLPYIDGLIRHNLPAIEAAAAERARLGHIREFLGSFELAEILHARNMCTAAHSSRIAGEIRGAWLAHHPEAE